MKKGPAHFFTTDLPQPENSPSEFALNKELSHYLKNVLRVEPGQEITLVHSEHKRAVLAKVTEIRKGQIQVALKQELPFSPTPASAPIAIVGNLKKKKNELVLEKLTELCAAGIFFFQGQRSVASFGSDSSNLLARYQEITLQAAQQCGRMELPAVRICSCLASALEQVESQFPSAARLVCSLGEGAKNLTDSVSTYSCAALVIGPEGDFAPAEVQLLAERQYQPVSLGDLRLRSETACIAAVSALRLLSIH
jgi:16S rRNA (uracil1498-N3)-methyltransferase